MNIPLDAYTWRARILPVLLTSLPLDLALWAYIPDIPREWKTLSGILVAAGGLVLIAQLGRDLGKRIESRLFASWGGKPTTRRLRHRDAPNQVTLERQYQKLRRLVPETGIPTPEQERADPNRADQVYDSLVAVLRGKTRERKKFPLVFEENCNYGFRRNLLGLRPLGLFIAILGTGAIVVLILGHLLSHMPLTPLLVLLGLLNAIALLLWIFWITPNWVRTSADAYAERLLEAIDEL